MYYAELEARAELRPWIAAHWHFRVADGAGEIEHLVPLTGGAMVHVHNRAPDLVILTGPRVEPLRVAVRAGDEFWGTHLWPGTTGSLLGVGADALRDAVVPIDRLVDAEWPRSLATRLASLPELDREREAALRLDQAWAKRAEHAAPLDHRIMQGVFRLLGARGEIRVSRLAASVALSPRHFRRRFRAAVGLSPKELVRLRRLRSSAAHLVASDDAWVRLAADHGFVDQAHLVREYRALLGVTPSEFRRHAFRIEHGVILS